ncbi:lysophospholipid acyltransferase family protein [Pendulispora albinea]|uniref:Acyltransferase family protein n=1 Tax=Pendulispora albinea TaxID=2741071 RepID=A0ABZ2M8Q4_9BACT
MPKESIAERVERLQIPFSPWGVDPYGVSKKHLTRAYTALEFFYRHYFSVETHGLENVPRRGRAMLVGNHAGGIAIDATMVWGSVFFEMEPPRLAQGMAEKFIIRFPFASSWSGKVGQFTGLPEHAERLLEEDRLLMVFPEGARGTAKLFKERNSLVDFGTGFLRLALKTKTPIIPFGFLGGGDALPTVANSYKLGKKLGVPYIPIVAYWPPIPLPVKLEIHYGAPLVFQGTGSEEDEVIAGYVDEVKSSIAQLIDRGLRVRRGEPKGSLQLGDGGISGPHGSRGAGQDRNSR